jgi:protein SCO1/2
MLASLALGCLMSVALAGAQEEGGTAEATPATTSSADNQPLAVGDDDPYGVNQKPKAAEGIGVDDYTGETIVGDATFNDHNNNRVRFVDLFDGKRPIMLSFNYSNCPKLCSVQLQNMVSTLREVDFEVGQDFQVVSISIDPTEQTSRSRDTRELYMGQYNRPESADGWHFLTGDRKDIEDLARQTGFRYKYLREQKLYSHPPVFILVSPEGKIVRYIHGLNYDAVTIRRALIESAKGKIGSAINQLAYGLGCFVFDESTGKYTMQAMGIMRIGGLLTAALLLICLAPYWFFKRRQPGEAESSAHAASIETPSHQPA